MKTNKNIIKSILLALPVLMLSGTASAQDDKCDAQINACNKAFDACDEQDDKCWEQSDACFDKIDDSCFSLDISDEDLGEEVEQGEDEQEEVEVDFGEVEFSEEDDAALKACEDAYNTCTEGNNSDCDTKLEVCILGEAIGDDVKVEETEESDIEEGDEEVKLGEDDDAALKACEDAYKTCTEGNNSDCESKLEVCILGGAIGDDVQVEDTEESDIEEGEGDFDFGDVDFDESELPDFSDFM